MDAQAILTKIEQDAKDAAQKVLADAEEKAKLMKLEAQAKIGSAARKPCSRRPSRTARRWKSACIAWRIWTTARRMLAAEARGDRRGVSKGEGSA